jgi:predicted nucleic acid-binding protein
MPSRRGGHPFIDSNVFIRFVAGDNPNQKARAAELFHRIDRGEITAIVPPIVIFETVFTLSSPRLYKLSREQIVGILLTLVRSPHIKVIDRPQILAALDLYLSTSLPFGDCYIAAVMKQLGSSAIYSFDEDFDHLPGIIRTVP